MAETDGDFSLMISYITEMFLNFDTKFENYVPILNVDS